MDFVFDEFLLSCQKLRESNIAFVVVTLTDKQNSVPQDIGSKLLVTANGIAFGTVGGGALEKNSIQIAQELLQNTKETTYYKQLHLNKDLQMTCGGSVSLLFEKIDIQSSWEIVIFGAGHVAQALIRTLLTLDCKIKCIDTRQEWLDKLPDSAKLDTIFVDEYTDYIENLEKNSFIIIMTSGHKYDLPILEKVLQKEYFPYVGVIGAKNKRVKLDLDLKKVGIIKEYYCPIGESFGTNNPNEIALSIVAQLLKVRDKNKGNRCKN